MIRTISTLIGILVATGSQACSLSYLTYEPTFEPGASTLTTNEIKRLAEWRSTVRGYRAGFDVYVMVWINKHAGISEALAKERDAYLRETLINLDVPNSDIKETEFRRSSHQPSNEAARDFFSRQRISINPRCPNACCDASSP